MLSAHSVAITGASSGLGRALAVEYAAPGVVLHLLGRNPTRLEETAGLARQKGAEIRMAAIDVRDSTAMSNFLWDGDASAPIDCLIANAGITHGSHPDGGLEDFASIQGIMDVNFGGALNSLLPLIGPMRQRRRGQIVLVSSLAAFAPQADGVGYAASKAALFALAMSLRDALRHEGLSVHSICPGYVDTPMSARYLGWKPLLMSAERAARRIRAGVARDKAVVAFPLPLYFAARVQQILPGPLRRIGMGCFRYKISPEAE